MTRWFSPKCFAAWSFSILMLLMSNMLIAQQPADNPDNIAELQTPQQRNAEMFRKFQRELLTLAQRLEKSSRPEDKDRAKVIFAALELSQKENLDNQFQKLIASMAGGSGNVKELNVIAGQDEQLQKALSDIMLILMTDDESARIKAEIKSLEEFLKIARRLKRNQEIIRGLTESARADAERIAKEQKDLAERTNELGKQMGGDKKEGDGKPGDKAMAKAESKSEPKPGDNAGTPKADTGEKKSESKANGNGKPKDGEPKDGAGEPKKSGESKASPKPSSVAKPGESKPGAESKPSEGAKSKPSESKAKGEGKGSGKPSDSKKGGDGKPMPSQGKPSEGQQSQNKGDGKPSSGQPSDPAAQKPQVPGRKQIQEAYPEQQGAQKDLEKDKRDDAAKKEDKAIAKLQEGIDELEKRLKQLREEEMLKLLANLEARCKNMLAMQIGVNNATKSIDATIMKKGEKTTAEVQKSQQEASKEAAIIAEADKALKLLETEGSAVAFATIMQEVRLDMITVRKRLDASNVGTDTQLIEENIAEMLRFMIDALQKKQAEIEKNKGKPKPPGPPPPKKLIDLLAELKLIKALQVQVNTRTKMYGVKSPTEQADDPLIENELRQLAERQAKLEDMINAIATGANQ